ncbi:hypothetical protein AGR7B_pAt0083 [Agrobacterium deltaense RV3]|nr:hypothetical protein AGR7B_pAt0083 [Agrobacterium deltaense RV3]
MIVCASDLNETVLSNAIEFILGGFMRGAGKSTPHIGGVLMNQLTTAQHNDTTRRQCR